MVDDSTLAREAQLVFSNTMGFQTAGHSLNAWEGTVRAGGREFKFEIYLPDYFPNVPPVVRSLVPIKHANVDDEGFVNLRILDSWRAEFHVYQVINALKGLMARAPPVPADVSITSPRRMPESVRNSAPATMAASSADVSSQEHRILKEELTRLKDDMSTRDEEIARIRARQASGLPTSEGKTREAPAMDVDQRTELESERLAVSEMLAHLHERYDSGEISVYDFSKLLKKYQKDLHIIEKKLEYLNTQRG